MGVAFLFDSLYIIRFVSLLTPRLCLYRLRGCKNRKDNEFSNQVILKRFFFPTVTKYR